MLCHPRESRTASISSSQQLPFKDVLNGDRREHFSGVQVTLATFVYDPYHANRLRLGVVFDVVQLARFKRGFIASVLDANSPFHSNSLIFISTLPMPSP